MNVRNLPAHIIKQAAERKASKAFRARLGRGRYADVVKEIAEAIQQAFEARNISTLFGLEGPLRHKIRAELCLQRWRWIDADRMALEMLADAFTSLKAERPEWNEGQLEWTIEAGTLIERTRCVRCHNPLPEGHYKFCSRLCNTSHSGRMSVLRKAGEEEALRMVINLMD